MHTTRRPLTAVACICGLTITLSTLSVQAKPPNSAEDKKSDVSTDKQAQAKPKLSPLYLNTHILTVRGKHTIIPKGSLIYLPAKDKSKVIETPSGKFVFWPDFFEKNQSWLWTYEVSLEQAKGLKPIPEAKLEAFKQIGRTVVATYKKSPISILAPPAPPSGENKKNQ